MRLSLRLRRRIAPLIFFWELLSELPQLWLSKFLLAGLLGVAVAWLDLSVEHLPLAALWAFLQDIPMRVWAGAGVALAVLVVFRKAEKRRQPVGVPVLREPRPTAWWIVPAVLLIGGAVTVVAWWLLDGMPDGLNDYQAVTARRGAIQTALGAGAGIGAAITLMLAFRRQRHQEIANLVTAHDATERRVTELYTKAVEQLGHATAAVRLGGLYALERLAQDNPDHRQTIVNVICAYLRMPYALPLEPGLAQERVWALRDTVRGQSAGAASAPLPEAGTSPQGVEEERQVRLAAQRILADHLRDDRIPRQRKRGEAADPRFWEGMRIDLTGAILIDLDFTHCRPVNAVFTGAFFAGDVRFAGAFFSGITRFNRASFAGYAGFAAVFFAGTTRFDRASFAGITWFRGASFAGIINFDRAVITTPADNHAWPKGWRVIVHADGTGRLEREAGLGDDLP